MNRPFKTFVTFLTGARFCGAWLRGLHAQKLKLQQPLAPPKVQSRVAEVFDTIAAAFLIAKWLGIITVSIYSAAVIEVTVVRIAVFIFIF